MKKNLSDYLVAFAVIACSLVLLGALTYALSGGFVSKSDRFLEIDYPEHLSRGLVLVKWWLLALPQYVVVAILAGGFGVGRAGLITVLVLVAGVLLAATGRYPRELFELVVGLNRWCFRVLAYAALMRDEYPPFRLDLGGQEPVAT